VAEVAKCDACGAAQAELSSDGQARCAACGAVLHTGREDRVLVAGDLGIDLDAGLVITIGDTKWSWADLGDAVAETLASGRTVELHAAGLGLRPPEHREAVALLSECLPRRVRHALPRDELHAACRRLRLDLRRDDPPWPLIAAAAGWGGRLPRSDPHLWLDAALSIAAPREPLPIDEDLQVALAGVEPDDWLATILELTRAGPGTPVDPESLLVLSARCMDVDSGAFEPHRAACMAQAFELVVPLWFELGAVDDDGLLTRLGAWGLAPALARAWGGDLDRPPPRQVAPPSGMHPVGSRNPG
jgi:hypothetical protein